MGNASSFVIPQSSEASGSRALRHEREPRLPRDRTLAGSDLGLSGRSSGNRARRKRGASFFRGSDGLRPVTRAPGALLPRIQIAPHLP